KVGTHELSSLLSQIKKDGARFEYHDRPAAILWFVINNRRNAIVGRDRKKLWFELIALADIYRNDLVRNAGLLEKDSDLVAIGRGPVVQVDHRYDSLVGLVEKSKRWPCNALEQGALRFRTGKDPNAEQDAEQQSRQIFGDAISRNLSFGLRRLDGSMEECLDLSEAVGDEGAQLPVVRCHFKRRVD